MPTFHTIWLPDKKVTSQLLDVLTSPLEDLVLVEKRMQNLVVAVEAYPLEAYFAGVGSSYSCSRKVRGTRLQNASRPPTTAYVDACTQVG